jgi:uncharacterized OB-fold protein
MAYQITQRETVLLRELKKGLSDRHQIKQRECLDCGKLFFSTWCGHRICQECSERTKGWVSCY